jgi:hypothetical protein
MPLIRRLLTAAIAYSTILGVDTDKRSRWMDIVEHLATLPLTTTTSVEATSSTDSSSTTVSSTNVSSNVSRSFWVWAETNVTTASVFGANAWYPLDYYSAIHPGAGVGISSRTGSSSDVLQFQLATRTVAHINGAGGWRPESGAQMDWIAAVRLGWNATELVLSAAAALKDGGMYPNLYGVDGGGGLETCGVTLAINEMLLQSHEKGLRFFAVWPRHRHASFSTLRAVGAFLVSAVYHPASRTVSANILSTAGGACAVYAGDDGKPPVVTASNGVVVKVSAAGVSRFQFATSQNTSYTMAMAL